MSDIIQKAELVITHGGGAHRDEFLAVALILAKKPTLRVERRDPTRAELDDPTVLVVDVGGEYDPTLGNFDHHQFPKNFPPACSFTLLARKLGVEELARNAFKWFGFTEEMDCCGPFQMAEKLGLSKENFFSTLSPVEDFVLREFSKQTVWVYGDLVHTLMTKMGMCFLTHLEELGERLEWLNREAKFFMVGDLRVVDTRCIPKNQTPAFALDEFVNSVHPDTAVSLTNDDRGKGFCLFRRKDHPAIDFCLVKDDPRIIFAHANGFVCKTVPGLTDDDIQEIILLSAK